MHAGVAAAPSHYLSMVSHESLLTQVNPACSFHSPSGVNLLQSSVPGMHTPQCLVLQLSTLLLTSNLHMVQVPTVSTSVCEGQPLEQNVRSLS